MYSWYYYYSYCYLYYYYYYRHDHDDYLSYLSYKSQHMKMIYFQIIRFVHLKVK